MSEKQRELARVLVEFEMEEARLGQEILRHQGAIDELHLLEQDILKRSYDIERQIDQVERCERPNRSMSYGGWIAATEERVARGEKQVWCATCQRWQWPDRLCQLAHVMPGPEETDCE